MALSNQALKRRGQAARVVREEEHPDLRAYARTAFGPMDMPAMILVCCLLGIGLITMFSASFSDALYNQDDSTHYIRRQAIFAVAGFAAMLIISRFDYHRLSKLAIPLIIVSVLLLCAVWIPGLGETRNDARRWINLGFTTFQPSEIAKVAVIVSFAALASKYGLKMKKFKYGVVPFLAIIGVFAGLLYPQPHLSATVIIALTGFIIIFVGGTKISHLMALAGIGCAGVGVFLATRPYAMTRINVWLDPFSDALGDGFQGVQSLLAIGSGGVWGLGLGQSRQKHLFLPEPANDFIFSVICEELGFIGAILILLVFAAFIIRGFWVAVRAKDRLGSLLAVGITAQIAIQTVLNICVVTGLMPVTGASLPFFSYGGTSLLIQLAEVGILLNISRQMEISRSG